MSKKEIYQNYFFILRKDVSDYNVYGYEIVKMISCKPTVLLLKRTLNIYNTPNASQESYITVTINFPFQIGLSDNQFYKLCRDKLENLNDYLHKNQNFEPHIVEVDAYDNLEIIFKNVEDSKNTTIDLRKPDSCATFLSLFNIIMLLIIFILSVDLTNKVMPYIFPKDEFPKNR